MGRRPPAESHVALVVGNGRAPARADGERHRARPAAFPYHLVRLHAGPALSPLARLPADASQPTAVEGGLQAPCRDSALTAPRTVRTPRARSATSHRSSPLRGGPAPPTGCGRRG